jgi:hypothetical protein
MDDREKVIIMQSKSLKARRLDGVGALFVIAAIVAGFTPGGIGFAILFLIIAAFFGVIGMFF